MINDYVCKYQTAEQRVLFKVEIIILLKTELIRSNRNNNNNKDEYAIMSIDFMHAERLCVGDLGSLKMISATRVYNTIGTL